MSLEIGHLLPHALQTCVSQMVGTLHSLMTTLLGAREETCFVGRVAKQKQLEEWKGTNKDKEECSCKQIEFHPDGQSTGPCQLCEV